MTTRRLLCIVEVCLGNALNSQVLLSKTFNILPFLFKIFNVFSKAVLMSSLTHNSRDLFFFTRLNFCSAFSGIF